MAARVSMYSVGTTVKGFITKKKKDEIELNLEDGTIAIAQGDNASGMQFVYWRHPELSVCVFFFYIDKICRIRNRIKQRYPKQTFPVNMRPFCYIITCLIILYHYFTECVEAVRYFTLR